MKNSYLVALFMSPFQGDNNYSGRLASLTSACVESPLSCRPEKRYKKGDWNPHGYWPLAALTNTTSYRRSAFLGRLLSGRNKDNKSVITKACVGQQPAATSHLSKRNQQ